MKRCDSHYPILGNWTVVSETDNVVTYQCPKCGEIYVGKRKRGAIDFRTDDMKEDSAKYAKDILQPRRGGEPSREFIRAYPEQAKKEFTKEEIKGAKDVWKDQAGVKHIKYDRM